MGARQGNAPTQILFWYLAVRSLSLTTNQIWSTYEHFSRLTSGNDSSHSPCSLKRNDNFLNINRYLYSIHIPSFVILAETVLEFPKRRFFGLWVGTWQGNTPTQNYFGISEEDLSVYLQTKFGAHTSIFRIWRLEITPDIARVHWSGVIIFWTRTATCTLSIIQVLWF